MKSISFLIGSGFSNPAGFPTTTQLNERLKKINANEICIHTSGDARFLKGQNNPNAHWMKVNERLFVQEFLEFYNGTILKDDKQFHYETFYDYYRYFLSVGQFPKELVDFLQGFIKRHNMDTDERDLLFQFNFSFNHLISHLLSRRFERVHLCKPYHQNHSAFLNLVEDLSRVYIVHLHSLNHDLYIEHLASSDSIQAKLDDGFEELGSPYYGDPYDPYEKYKVRLPRFVNKFDQNFRLYKLHGSIDNYWFQDDYKLELIKLKRGVGKDVFKEVLLDNKLQYMNNLLNLYPDFLCGTTTKIEHYDLGDYYPIILKHFEENLKSSESLIVIGYGFADTRINHYIENVFFIEQNKKIFIVDVKEPSTKLIKRKNVYYVEGGVVGMDIKSILDKVRV